jgi:hypothetical protein
VWAPEAIISDELELHLSEAPVDEDENSLIWKLEIWLGMNQSPMMMSSLARSPVTTLAWVVLESTAAAKMPALTKR